LLKFSASVALPEVTTFQPARPPLMRSSEANLRATPNGSSKLVDAVHTRPMLRVNPANAESKANGSIQAT
jgi:hypothetical protein